MAPTSVDHVAWVMHNVQLEFKKTSRDRRRTAFYWFVQGGNVEVVSEVVDRLKAENQHDELDWLLNLNARLTSRQSYCNKLGRALVMVLLLLLALTPFFSMVLAAVMALVPSRTHKEKKSDLPLLLAVMGEEENVVQKLKSSGVCISHVDSNHNNIFHLLVCYSTTEPVKACAAYRLILQLYQQDDDLCKLLTENMDEDGLTPLEACIKYGAPTLFAMMCDTEGVVKRTLVRVTPSRHYIAPRVLQADTLPGQLSRGLTAYNNPVMMTGEEKSTDSGVHMVEEEQISCNVSSSKHTPAERQCSILNLKSEEEQCFEKVRYDISRYETMGVWGRQSLLLGLLAARDVEPLDENEVTCLLENVLIIEWCARKHATRMLKVLQYVLRLVFTLAALVLGVLTAKEHEHLPLVTQYIETMEEMRTTLFGKLANRAVKMGKFARLGCGSSNGTLGLLHLDGCSMKAFQQIQRRCGEQKVTDELKRLRITSIDELWSVDDSYVYLLYSLLAVSVMVILWGQLRQLAWVIQSARAGRSVWGMLAVRLPGSWVDSVLLACASWVLVIYTALVLGLDTLNIFSNPLLYRLDLKLYLFCLYQVLVFLSALYAMRLLPGIGHFIITTIKMGQHLSKFLVVYGFVFICVSFLFHVVMRDDKCKMRRLPQFATVPDSMFETFKLLLGHGDFYYNHNIPAKMLYLIYCIFCVLLLLNFIIAVMSSTADHIMRSPWKTILVVKEHLQETLSAESLLHCLLLPISGCARRWLLLRQGYSVRQEVGTCDKGITVCIEVQSRSKNKLTDFNV